ncbi:MAG: DUF2339 domain-containing protein [Phycisphaerales bacterium]
MGFVAACLWALLVAGPRRVLREPPETDAQRLGAALMLESGALLIGAIALGFSGSTEIVAWIGLGAAAVAAGSWIRARGLHVYGLVVLGIVTVRLIAHDSWSGGPTVAGEAVAGLYLTRWALFMACVSLAWFGGAFLVLRPHADVGWSAVAAGTGALGAALAFGALLHERAEPRAVALAWMVLSLTIASVGRLDNRLLLDRIGLGGVLAAALAWMIADPPYPARDWERAGAVLVLFSSPFWIGVALAATLAAHAWWLRRVARAPGTNAKWVRFAALACLVTLFAATTSELARWAARLTTDDTARQAAVSIWWGLCGMGLVVVGFLARGALIRRVGLALLATAVGKALVVDLARVELEGRVASFLGLGLLMLGVAVLYNRVTAALARREATQRDREKHAAGGDTPGVV